MKLTGPWAVFRVDANPTIGQGHLRRCLTLARQLQEEGFRIILLACDRSSSLAKNYEEEFPVKWLEDASVEEQFGKFLTDWEWDALSTIQVLNRNGIESAWIIVDNYDLDAKWERKVREQGHRILAIDDFRNRPHSVDIIVSDSTQEFAQELLENPQATRILRGSKFSLVDKEFSCASHEASWRSGSKTVLISYGSSDHTNETHKALRAIASMRLDARSASLIGPVEVVLGPTNRNRHQITDNASISPTIDS